MLFGIPCVKTNKNFPAEYKTDAYREFKQMLKRGGYQKLLPDRMYSWGSPMKRLLGRISQNPKSFALLVAASGLAGAFVAFGPERLLCKIGINGLCDEKDKDNIESNRTNGIDAFDAACVAGCLPVNMPLRDERNVVGYGPSGANTVLDDGTPDLTYLQVTKDHILPDNVIQTNGYSVRFKDGYPGHWHTEAVKTECGTDPATVNKTQNDPFRCPIFQTGPQELCNYQRMGNLWSNCNEMCVDRCRTSGDPNSGPGPNPLCPNGRYNPCNGPGTEGLLDEKTIMYIGVGVALLIIVVIFTSGSKEDEELDFGE